MIRLPSPNRNQNWWQWAEAFLRAVQYELLRISDQITSILQRIGFMELAFTPEQFGAKGDGVTNDSVPILAAMTAAVQSTAKYTAVRFRDGAEYLCDSTAIPNIPGSDGRYLCLYAEGGAFIVASGGGDPEYLWAPATWASNSVFGNRRTIISGLNFDGRGLVDYCLIVRGNTWLVEKGWVTGALVQGIGLKNKSRDGLNTGGSVDCTLRAITSRQNTGDGIGADDESVDYTIDCVVCSGNTGFGASLLNGAGAKTIGLNCYGNTAGAAQFGNFGWGQLGDGCHFDGNVEILSMNASWPGVFGPAFNVKNGNLISSDGSPELIALDTQAQGLGATFVHNNNASNARLFMIMGGYSANPNPIVWPFASPVGTVIASMHWSQPGRGFIDGILTPTPNTMTGGVAPNLVYIPVRTMTNGTLTSVIITLNVMTGQLAGSHLEIDLYVDISSGGATQIYHLKAEAGYNRRAVLATSISFFDIIYEADSAASGISAAGAWSTSGTTGDHTAILQIDITHPTPTSGQAYLIGKVRAQHRYVSTMVIT